MEDTLSLRQAFEAEEHELRLRQSKVACILGIVLIPAGITLDYMDWVGLIIGGIVIIGILTRMSRSLSER